MAKKDKKISVAAFDKAVAEHCEKIKTVEWNGLEIEIKKNISLDEMIAFVDDVISICFDANTGTYYPNRKSFTIRAAVIELYTNLSMPDSLQKKYEMVYGTDLFETILINIDEEQYSDIVRAINDGLKFHTSTGAAAVMRQMNDVMEGFEKLEQNLSGIFAGVKETDIQKIVRAISDNGLDEEKLMRAYLESKKPASEEEMSAV